MTVALPVVSQTTSPALSYDQPTAVQRFLRQPIALQQQAKFLQERKGNMDIDLHQEQADMPVRVGRPS